mmetsp:Transcript_11401/g.32018  ORF Transcript_11401/g.32018 Transcript_11401/m.32018 type:complete len:221 (-) Transcript_11401:488-1150(-)
MIFNLFRLLADFFHLLTFVVLLYKIYSKKSCSGISLKTQILYCLVFTMRYVDLAWNFEHMYNTVMKILFLAFSYATVYLIMFKYQTSYRQHAAHDNFRIIFLIVPSFLLALAISDKLRPFEVLWTTSILLESVAILPQLFLLTRCSKVDVMTADYVFLLGAYRALYIFNWIVRYMTEANFVRYSTYISCGAGLVQTIIYLDFFYYYLQSRWYGKDLELPK